MPTDDGQDFDDVEAFETIRWEFDDASGIGSIVLDRPDSLNAMSRRTLEELAAAIDRFEALDRAGEGISVRALVIEGAGDRAFSPGVDVDEIGEEHYPHTAATFREALFAVRDYGAPVVAKIDGYCLGGGLELALLCDFRIASERSELGFPEVELGIFPSAVGTTQRLPLLVGPSRAKHLMMTGEFVPAARAHEDGFVDRVCPAEDLDAVVSEYAGTLADRAPLAVRAIKDAVDASHDMHLTQGTEYEHRAYLPLLHTEDYEEGVTAYAADREPVWQGK